MTGSGVGVMADSGSVASSPGISASNASICDKTSWIVMGRHPFLSVGFDSVSVVAEVRCAHVNSVVCEPDECAAGLQNHVVLIRASRRVRRRVVNARPAKNRHRVRPEFRSELRVILIPSVNERLAKAAVTYWGNFRAEYEPGPSGRSDDWEPFANK